MEFERRCWAEVDLGALRHNFKLVRESAVLTLDSVWFPVA